MYWRLCGALLSPVYRAGKPSEKTWEWMTPAVVIQMFVPGGGKCLLPRKAPVF